MGLVYRLDASDLTTMFTDAGKTTQVTDGASVYCWAPKSGSAVTTDAVQATAINRPTYRANYASTGLPGVEFDQDRVVQLGEIVITLGKQSSQS